MHVSWFYPAVIEAKEIAGCTVSPPTKLLFICMLISMLHFRCKVYEHFLHFTPVSRKTKTKVFFTWLTRSSPELHKLSLLKGQLRFVLFLMSNLLRIGALINTIKTNYSDKYNGNKRLYKRQAQLVFIRCNK